MKTVNMETNYNVIKETAKVLGLKFVGIKKEVLISQINAKIEESKKATKAPKGKWFEQENAFPYTEGETLFVGNHTNKSIVGRLFKVIGPSTKRNAIKGQLINPKTGEPQNTSLSLDFQMVTEQASQLPTLVPQSITA